MPRISIRGNTRYHREPEHTEVIDGQGNTLAQGHSGRREPLERRPLHRPLRQEDHEPQTRRRTSAVLVVRDGPTGGFDLHCGASGIAMGCIDLEPATRPYGTRTMRQEQPRIHHA